jgi:glycosidase
MTKGFREPSDFFNQFAGHDSLGSHRETGRYHVSILDDHDMVGRGKNRFAANNPNLEQVAHAVGVQLTTLGIPCIYYGTEQAFDGKESYHDFSIEPRDSNGKIPFDDRYIRESMFGGTFGAFETENCHFFDENHPTYLRIAAIALIRNGDNKIGLALRRGRQYLRETSILGRPFNIPAREELVAWSRILFDQEVLIAVNTNGTAVRGADITVDGSLSPIGGQMTYLYRSDWADSQLHTPPTDQTVNIISNGSRATVKIDLPPAGMAILTHFPSN